MDEPLEDEDLEDMAEEPDFEEELELEDETGT